MGKTRKKPRQHSFYEHFGKAKEPRVVRTMHEPVVVGLSLVDRFKPRCFWLNGEAYPIYRVVKRWRDEFHRRWYRVKTARGTFDLYEHRRWLSREENRYRSYWWLAAEVEMVPVRHITRLKEQAEAARAAGRLVSSRPDTVGTPHSGHGDSQWRTLRIPGSRCTRRAGRRSPGMAPAGVSPP